MGIRVVVSMGVSDIILIMDSVSGFMVLKLLVNCLFSFYLFFK